jgi:DKNYY family
MNRPVIIARTLGFGFVLLFGMVACKKKEAAPSGPSPVLSTDTDLGHGYVRRDGAIHFIGGGITGTGANATRIDMPSPQLLRKVTRSQFGPFKTAEGLDVGSFEVLSETYTRDESRVYYKVISNDEFIVIVLPEADPASFELLEGNLTRDKNRVWYTFEIRQGVDAATVEPIAGGPVYKDKNSVFYQYEAIDGADPATFKHVGSGYYADSKRVYWCTDPIPDADPATFKVLGDSFVGKDRSRAFRSGEPLDGLDAASLELIVHHEAGFQIYSDKNGIQVNKMTFPRSKPGKVEVIDPYTIKAGDLFHLVERSRSTPTTLFKQDGKLMAESPAYEPTSREVNGLITAEVTAGGLKNIRVGPLPGSTHVPVVPDWQMEVFKHGHTVERMIELGKRIK